MFGVVFGCVWPFEWFTLFQVFQVKLFTAVLGCSSCKRRFSGCSCRRNIFLFGLVVFLVVSYCLRCLRRCQLFCVLCIHFVVCGCSIRFSFFCPVLGCVRLCSVA